MKIYESINNRLTEIEHILDYSISKDIKSEISTLIILTDKYYIKTRSIYEIIKVIIKSLNYKASLSSLSLKKICDTITDDIKNNNIKESLITLDVKDNKESKYIKIIFINIENKLEDVYHDLCMKKKSKEEKLYKLKKSIYMFMEELRSVGAHIYYSMKKNNIYQCNIIDLLNKDYLCFMNENNIFKSISILDFLNVCLLVFEGFSLSKYTLKEIKNDNIYKKTETGRFINNVAKVGGSIKSKKQTSKKLLKTKVKTNHYIHIVNINELNAKKIKDLYTDLMYDKINKELDNILIKVKSIYFARDIVNLPSNKTGSLSIINTVKHFISRNKLPLKVSVLEPKECLKKGLKLLYSVGQGAEPENQSRLLILEYYGNKKNKDDGYLLIGKGVTMDTGGISIKPYDQIPEMKSDVAGACSVISSICGLSRIGIKKNVVGMIPLSENTVGHKSTIPGDVIKSYKGLNVEIIDTDAEGRLIMADTLTYGCELFPKYNIIELSTLTGEAEKISCGRFSTAIGINYSENEINNFVNTGEYNGERVLVLPFITGFDDELKSDIADIRNVSRNCKGQIYPSTTFLSYFINDDTKFLHVDIGGTAFTDYKNYKYEHYESSGIGVKLLIDYLSI